MRLFEALPFPRGTTLAPSDAAYASTVGVVGRLFAVYDASSKSEILLRVVAAGSATTLTPGLFVGFDSTELMRKTGTISANGAIARPIDSAYNGQAVAANTLFYVVEQGPLTVAKTTGTGTAVTAQEALYVDTAGKVNGTLSSGYVVGYSTEDAADGASSVGAFIGA